MIISGSSKVQKTPIGEADEGGGKKPRGVRGRVAKKKKGEMTESMQEAVGLIKRAVQSGAEVPFESGLAIERELQQQLFQSNDATEGLAAYMEKRTAEKASLIYDALGDSEFYTATAAENSRSTMNITFVTPSKELDAKFVAEATEQGLDGLKGHRSVGGMRASIYNAFPRAGCEVLVQFMKDFAAKNG